MKKIIKVLICILFVSSLTFAIHIDKANAQSNSSIACYRFDNNLNYGDTSVEVDNLVKALSADGISINPGTIESKKVTFDPNVFNAVIAFQGKYGINQTGSVGSSTRAVLNNLYNCGNVITDPAITNPNSNKGSVSAILFDNGTKPVFTITTVDNGTEAPYEASFVLKYGIQNTTNDDVYISKNATTTLVTKVNGTASVKIPQALTYTSPSTSAGDTSTAYVVPAGTTRVFTYQGSLNNSKGITGNQSIQITQINYGTSATNLNSRSITSGFEKFITPAVNLHGVATTTTISSIIILNPKGGENYNIGDTIIVNWSTNYSGEYMDLILRRENTFPSAPADSGTQAQRIPNTGSYKMRIGNIGESGKYYLRMMCIKSPCNIADTPLFNIRQASASSSITVLSPNGGETLYVGGTYDLTWKSVGVDNVSINFVKDTSSYYVAGPIPAKNGKYTFTIPSRIPAGTYKLYIIDSKSTANSSLYDSSDNYLKIAVPVAPKYTSQPNTVSTTSKQIAPVYNYTNTYSPTPSYTYSPTYTSSPAPTYSSTPVQTSTYTQSPTTSASPAYTSSPSVSSSPTTTSSPSTSSSPIYSTSPTYSPSASPISPSVSLIGNGISLGALILESVRSLLGL